MNIYLLLVCPYFLLSELYNQQLRMTSRHSLGFFTHLDWLVATHTHVQLKPINNPSLYTFMLKIAQRKQNSSDTSLFSSTNDGISGLLCTKYTLLRWKSSLRKLQRPATDSRIFLTTCIKSNVSNRVMSFFFLHELLHETT